MSFLHQVDIFQSGQRVAGGESRGHRTGSATGSFRNGRQPESILLRQRDSEIQLFVTGFKRRGGSRNPGHPMFIRLEVGTPMCNLIGTGGPHHGDIGSGIEGPGREAKVPNRFLKGQLL